MLKMVVIDEHLVDPEQGIDVKHPLFFAVDVLAEDDDHKLQFLNSYLGFFLDLLFSLGQEFDNKDLE